VDRGLGHVPFQFAVLGAIFVTFEVLIDGTVGLTAGRLGGWLSHRQRTWQTLEVPRLPLLFYFFFEDLAVVLSALDAADVETVRLGYPPHAPGGEVKLTDPDGNTVLLGQEERSASQPPAEDDAPPRFSLLKEAAAAVQARGGTTVTCQVSSLAGVTCSKTPRSSWPIPRVTRRGCA
jgi:hypothetical protein